MNPNGLDPNSMLLTAHPLFLYFIVLFIQKVNGYKAVYNNHIKEDNFCTDVICKI